MALGLYYYPTFFCCPEKGRIYPEFSNENIHNHFLIIDLIILMQRLTVPRHILFGI